MTASTYIPNPLLAANTTDLPRPDAKPGRETGTNDNTLPNVADTGRITFGAGYRLPSNK